MIARRLAELDVSAASSLVLRDDRLHVVADDELDFAIYDRTGRPLERIPLLPGELPVNPVARKKQKPDFEALADLPGGWLVALGSGSRPNRCRGVALRGDVRHDVNLAPLYQAIGPELNVEGAAAVARDDRLYLLSRGNGPSGRNLLVELRLAGALAALAAGAPWGPDLMTWVRAVKLPELEGVPLTFTDVTALADGTLLFAATAEATRDTYEDAPVAGSAIGRLAPDGKVLWVEPIQGTREKMEGIAAAGDGELLLVSDPDDPARRAGLYAVVLSSPK